MQELSLHILDIAKNSVSANAKDIRIEITENTVENTFVITITDNGCGMDKDFLIKVTDPFITTRTTRGVGLGIPLFKMAAELTNGSFDIQSQKGKGTKITAVFTRDHYDRVPLGDISNTLALLISGSPAIHFVYCHQMDEQQFTLDTDEVKAILGDVPIDNAEVIEWIVEFMNENIKLIYGGKI